MKSEPAADTIAATALPTISVLLANYNHARFIATALKALAAQTLPPDEVLVIDDASTDDSVAVIDGFRVSLPQLRLLRNDRNLGVNATTNRALAEARGSHVICTGADDWLEPECVSRLAAGVSVHPKCPFYVSDYVQYFEATERLVHHRCDSELGPWYAGNKPQYFSPDELRHLLDRGFVWLPINAALVDRQMLLAVGGYDPKLRWHADWFATYTLALRYGFTVVPEPLSVFRVSAATYSGRGMRDKRQQRQVCTAIYDKLCEPEFADIYDALRRHPAAFSSFFRELTQVLVSRPSAWPYLASLARWWLGEVSHGRRPGILRELTARFRLPPYSKNMQP
jgi:glycosyltransferase involved in cell wall biosynthesis